MERVSKLGYDGHTGFRRVEEDVPGMRNGVSKAWRRKEIAWLRNNKEKILAKS